MCKILIGKFLSIMSSFILRNVYCRFQQILSCSSFKVCYLSSEEELEYFYGGANQQPIDYTML